MKKSKKFKRISGLFIAIIMFSSVVPNTSLITTVQAAANVQQIVINNGETKKIQLDNHGGKEKISYKLTRKALNHIGSDITYRFTYQIKIDGKLMVKKTWKDKWSDFWDTASYWKSYCKNHAVVVTDIDKSDGVKDILYYANNTRYRMQYKNGKIVTTENLDKTVEALKLPTVVNNRWGTMDWGTAGFEGREAVTFQVSYKDGAWSYSDKNKENIYQITTTGNGTATWVICLAVYDIGYMHVTMPLKLKNNKLQLASKTIAGTVLETGCSGAVNKKMSAYTTADGSKVAFTVTKGDVVEFISYKINANTNKVYIQVKNKAGKCGWISSKQLESLVYDGSLHNG